MKISLDTTNIIDILIGALPSIERDYINSLIQDTVNKIGEYLNFDSEEIKDYMLEELESQSNEIDELKLERLIEPHDIIYILHIAIAKLLQDELFSIYCQDGTKHEIEITNFGIRSNLIFDTKIITSIHKHLSADLAKAVLSLNCLAYSTKKHGKKESGINANIDSNTVDILITKLSSSDKIAIEKYIKEVESNINFTDVKAEMLDILKCLPTIEPHIVFYALYTSVKYKILDDFNHLSSPIRVIYKWEISIDSDVIDTYNEHTLFYLSNNVINYMKEHNKKLANQFLSLSFVEN